MNSSVRSKHMDLLRENCESEDLLKGEEPQPQLKDDQSDIKECSHGRRAGGRRRGVKVNGWEKGQSDGGQQSECQLDLEDSGKVQCLWRF